MRTLFLALLLFTIAPTANAQGIYPLPAHWWIGYLVDLSAASWHDSVAITMPEDETVLFKTPRTLHRGDADSIALWAEVPDGCTLKIGTAYNVNNFRVIEHGGTLYGPLQYGCYWIPFVVDTNASSPHSEASFIMVTQYAGPSARIDAVELAVPATAGVKHFGSTPEWLGEAHWYNELGIQDSIHGVIRH